MTKPNLTLIALVLLIIACTPAAEKTDDGKRAFAIPSDTEATIRMGGSYALLPFLEACSDSFKTRYPGIRFEIKASNSLDGIRGLEDGRFQLAMLSFPFKQGKPDSNLCCISVAQEAVVPVFNKNNPHFELIRDKGISPKVLQDLYTSDKEMGWGTITGSETDEKIHLLTREEGSGTARTWISFIWSSPENIKAKVVNSEFEMIEEINAAPLALGYCNLGYVFSKSGEAKTNNLGIMPIDRDMDGVIEHTDCSCQSIEEIHRCVWLGKFPKDLCRLLSITGNKESITPEGMAFVYFLLHEGQQIAKSMGYCELNNVQIENSLRKLTMAGSVLENT